MIINIQILRAFAAIVVIIFHAQPIVLQYGFSYSNYDFLLLDIQKWGSFGVDLFFIISGYIMFMINDRNPRSPLEFLLNRIKRILPMYWLLTLFLFCAYLIAPLVFNGNEYSIHHLASSLFFVSHQAGY